MDTVSKSLSEITSVASAMGSSEDIGFSIGRKLSGFGLGGSIGGSLGLNLGESSAFSALHDLMAKCETCELK